jgi:hypothetical protein
VQNYFKQEKPRAGFALIINQIFGKRGSKVTDCNYFRELIQSFRQSYNKPAPNVA